MDATDLAFAGLGRQAQLVRDGEVSSRELVELYLERIERIDPQLNSVRVTFAERALIEADQAAARRRAGDGGRPLLGVPILIKDDVDVAGEQTTYGSAATDGRPKANDAEVVRRLRAAGAIVIGKTLTPEMTQWPFTESETWGITRNPWDLDRTPGGSSGGSGAAVAAGLAAAALATDGAGSIRIPASCCALFGLKPQRGRVPEAPKVEPWQDLTVTGCLTRSVADTALWLDATADRDPGTPSYVQAAATPPRRLKIAYTTRNPLFAPLTQEQREAFERTIALLRELGHTVERGRPAVRSGPAAGDRPLPARDSRRRGRLAHPERLERRTQRDGANGAPAARRLRPLGARARRARRPSASAACSSTTTCC